MNKLLNQSKNISHAFFRTAAVGICALAIGWLPMSTLAHGDHDAPKASSQNLKPRVIAQSDVFELVGIYDKTNLTIYLDKTNSTAAIPNAKIEYETGNLKGIAKPEPNGTYSIALAEPSLQPTMPFTFTVTAGTESDLLAGDLVLKSATDAHEHSWWERLWIWVKSWFGMSDSHGISTANSSLAIDTPQRQSDGSVFLPKASQRQFGLGTQTVNPTDSERVQELTGRVIPDPAGSSRVQAAQAGRFELAGASFPTIGQAVKQGQVLGVLRPTVGVIERANQNAQAIDLTSATETARKRLARLEQLEGTVAQKDIDAARVELQSLTERSKGIRASLTTLETLVAPTSGIISSVSVSLGQVVEAKEILFEIIDPKRLRIEAQVSPKLLENPVQSAKASDGLQNYSLRYLGVSRTLQNGTLPMQFAVVDAANASMLKLAVGQPMQIFIATGDKLKGLVLPASAVVKNSKNQNIVWVQHAPEAFEPMPVATTALNGTQVLVTQGLDAGARVVVQATGLLNQIR